MTGSALFILIIKNQHNGYVQFYDKIYKRIEKNMKEEKGKIKNRGKEGQR